MPGCRYRGCSKKNGGASSRREKSISRRSTRPLNIRREGEECLYCRQPLSPEAVALLKKYRDYCNNDLRTELDAAGREIEAIRREFQQGVDFADVERRVGEVAGNGAGITAEQLTEIRDFVGKGKSIRDAIESRKAGGVGGSAPRKPRVC